MIQSTNRLSYTPMSLTVDDKPIYPVMGEMHFSRYRNRYWEEELCKMKSGGVDIVSLYTIRIHHEEIRGEFDFGGDKNLRKMYMMLWLRVRFPTDICLEHTDF